MKKIQSIGLHLGTAGVVTQSKSFLELKKQFIVETLRRYEPFKDGPLHMIRKMVSDEGKIEIPHHTFTIIESGNEYWKDSVHMIVQRFTPINFTIEQELVWQKKENTAILHVHAAKPGELTHTTSTSEVMLIDLLHNPKTSVLEKIEAVYERITIVFKKP